MPSNKILYVINAPTKGGAELGLLTANELGLFPGFEVEFLFLHQGDEEILNRYRAMPHVTGVSFASRQDHLSPAVLAQGLMAIVRRLYRGQPDLVICSLAQSIILTQLASLLFPRVKIAAFFHNTGFSKRLYTRLVSALSHRISVCLYDSDVTKRAVFTQIPHPERKIWLEVPLFAAEGGAVKTDYTLGPIPRILSIGRLNSQKNYFAAIEAVKLLKEAGVPVQLLIAGEGGLKDELEAFIERAGLQEQVLLLGYSASWSALAESADAYLLASTREGLSISTLEAMNLGLPVAATNVGGICDYGHHEQNMIIASGTDAEPICQALKQLLMLPDTARAALARNARQTVLSRYGRAAASQKVETARLSLLRYSADVKEPLQPAATL